MRVFQPERKRITKSKDSLAGRAAQTRSQLYILEDLQWADESTLALLIHLANRVVHVPVVIIGTYRDGYPENNPALVRTLEELIRMGIRPLKLGPLKGRHRADVTRAKPAPGCFGETGEPHL
jgi:hypothetical protein